MKFVHMTAAAVLFAGVSTGVVAQATSTGTTSTTAIVSAPPSGAGASFGADVRTLAHAHENDPTHHGIGTIVSEKTRAKPHGVTRVSSQGRATKPAETAETSDLANSSTNHKTNAPFGADVRTLAHSHENDAPHHGIGTIVSAKAHAKSEEVTHVASQARATDPAGTAKASPVANSSMTPAKTNASFGADVRTLAHSHENDVTHHGVGAIVSAKAKAKAKNAKHSSDQPDPAEAVEAKGTSEASLASKGRRDSTRDSAAGVATVSSASRDIANHKGAVADLRSSVRSEVGENRSNVAATRSDVSSTRGEVASTRAEVAATRSDVASTRAEVAATVANAKAVRETVKAARPGH